MAVAIIVAAGRGERLGASGPTAFAALGGETLLNRCLRAVAGVGPAVVALPPGTPPLDGVTCVDGGATRSASVRNALAAAPPGEPTVVVHDAARPLAPPALFADVLAALDSADAAIAAAPVTDTIKESDPEGLVARTIERRHLWSVQTPQAFHRAMLARALDVDDDLLAAATDDAWLVERIGGTVRLVPSPPQNLKVTTPVDLELAELLLRRFP
jgi:2-C-methyl-D-erythritol 4-phosphate cytidylyltransferase